jgi:hypothetical protein
VSKIAATQMQSILSDTAYIAHLLGCIRRAHGPIMDPYINEAIDTNRRIFEALCNASLVDVVVETKGEKVR